MPQIERIDFSPRPLRSLQEQVKAEILYEQETSGEYGKEMKMVEDPSIKRLFTFIENQEEYHKQKLMEFFKLMNRLTVGDLKKKDA
ncbi:MAG: ferritin family protein [Aquificaceae bacterium]|nr:ferritin family protein [Aquificaceae bacterium]